MSILYYESKLYQQGIGIFKISQQKIQRLLFSLGSFFGNLFNSKQQRCQQAMDCYKQAATNYKLAKQCYQKLSGEEAANVYIKMVELDKKIKGGQTAQYLIEAANMKQKVNTAGIQIKSDSISLMEQAIKILLKENRIINAAKLKKKIAQIYQNDKQYYLAMNSYDEAADMFHAQGQQKFNYNSCKLKIAQLTVLSPQPNYIRAIKILQQIAYNYLQNKLTAPSAKQIFFKSLLLSLAMNDFIGAGTNIERYCDEDPGFANTRQEKFIRKLINAIQENNAELFANATQLYISSYEFNQIIPLDKWKTTVLSKVKQHIKGQENNNLQDDFR